MSSPSKLLQLTAVIQSRVSDIEAHMQANHLTEASFEIGSPLETRLPHQLSQAREEVLEALTGLHALLLGPLPYFTRLLSPAVNIFNSLHFIYRFGVAQELALTETISYEGLALRCNVDPVDLRRFLRLAIANYVFREPHPNKVAHTAMSACLVEVPNFNDWVGLVCEEMLPASIHCVDAMSKWPGSNDSAHTGHAIANGVEVPFFDLVGMDPSRESRFANAMVFNNSAPFLNPSYLIDNIQGLEEGHVKSIFDIGGSKGDIGRAFISKYPLIEEYVVQDLPTVTTGSHVPDEFLSRLKFREYNFCHPQDQAGADIYLLRLVLHDWSDEKAIEILRNQVPAMKPESTLILNEVCLPEPGILTCYQEQFLRGFDLSMKNTFNGKERDAQEWKSLVSKVDPRLKIERIITPVGSLLSILEVKKR